MKVLNTKTFNELVEESTADLQAIGFNTSAGAIAKLFMNIVNKGIANLYNTLTINHIRAFVTTADGYALDNIGVLLQCFRYDDEDDDNFRYRIVNQCLTLATSNSTAIRLTVLTTEGVEDCVIKPYSMGAGSFSVVIIHDDDYNQKDVITNVYNRLLTIHGYGIRYDVSGVDNKHIKIKHKVIISDVVSDIERQDIIYEVRTQLSNYISTMGIGQPLITDKITQIIMNVSPYIIQEMNEELYIDDEKCLYVNQQCRWRERFVVSQEVDAIVIS